MSIVRTAAEILADVRASGVPDDDTPRTVDRLISSTRAAQILGLSVDAVRAAAHRGRLPHTKAGTHLRFYESDVRAYASRHLPPAGTAAPAAGGR